MTDVTGTTIWAGHDSNGHPTQISRPRGQIIYAYDAAGNLTQIIAQPAIRFLR